MFEGVVGTSQMCQNFFALASFGQVRCARTFFLGPRLDKSDGPNFFSRASFGQVRTGQNFFARASLGTSQMRKK